MKIGNFKIIDEQLCNKCPIYNDEFFKNGKRITCCVEPRFIVNNGKRKILFLGEAPGSSEDMNNKTFIGAAGKKFDELLKKVKLDQFDIRISNVVKCRPIKIYNDKLKDRQPTNEEIESCSSYLKHDLEFDPDLIITLGRTPTAALIKDIDPSSVRGKPQLVVIDNKEYVIFPVYHPAAVLYDNSKEKVLEFHLSMATKYLEELE